MPPGVPTPAVREVTQRFGRRRGRDSRPQTPPDPLSCGKKGTNRPATLTGNLYGEVRQNARRLRTSTRILRQVCGARFQADTLTSSLCCAEVTGSQARSMPWMNPRLMDVFDWPGRSSCARERLELQDEAQRRCV